jgi:hypothetical protein
MKKFGEEHIYKRKTRSGDDVYVVRISDIREPTGLFFNGTFKSLDFAKQIRDEQLTKLVLDKQKEEVVAKPTNKN